MAKMRMAKKLFTSSPLPLREASRKRSRILALATDVPALWNDPTTPCRERKRIVRLLVEDVTLAKGNEVTLHVRFRGGATRTLTMARPLPQYELTRYTPEVVAEIDRLLQEPRRELAG